MKRTVIIGALAGLALLVAVATVLAQQAAPPPAASPAAPPAVAAPPARSAVPARAPGMRSPNVLRMGQERVRPLLEAVMTLDLSDEQKTKIEGLKKEFDQQMAKLSPEVEKKVQELNEETQKAREANDQQKVAELTKKRFSVLGTPVLKVTEEFRANVKSLLTAAQLQKIEELLGPPPPPAAGILRIIQSQAKELQLTDEQQAALKKLAEKYPAEKQDEGRARIEEMRKAGRTTEEIGKAIKEINEKTVRMSKECLADLEKILTKEQMTKVRELVRPRVSALAPAGATKPEAPKSAPPAEGNK